EPPSCNQGEDTHDQLAGAGAGVDRGIIHHLEDNASLNELRDNAIEVGLKRIKPGPRVGSSRHSPGRPVISNPLAPPHVKGRAPTGATRVMNLQVVSRYSPVLDKCSPY